MGNRIRISCFSWVNVNYISREKRVYIALECNECSPLALATNSRIGLTMGVARIFQRRGHTVSNRGYSRFRNLNIVGCLSKKRLTKEGGGGLPRTSPPPLATPLGLTLYGVKQQNRPYSRWPPCWFAIIMQISHTLLRAQTKQVREVITFMLATQMICFTFIECLSPKCKIE